ncbi:oxidoreductase [Candidatus Epulonipiscium fishelsonii]|nr:oxidoreductase [Epulopiscium sp. SCG-B05WGA-EpuloA1]
MKKTILLTGATDGIGFETAKMFAKDGHNLLIHGRSKQKLETTKDALLKINPNLVIETFLADFSILAEVRSMAKTILSKFTKLDILINNAGIFVVDESKVITTDGLDIRFSVNTIAPYILTKMLIPILGKNSRVVNVSSAAQDTINFEAFNNNKKLSNGAAYAQSKLAIIMWTMEMAEEFPNGPMFVSVNPKSYLGSKMVRDAYGKEGFDLQIGADILYNASLSEEFKDANGKYYDNDNCVFADPHADAFNKETRIKLIEEMAKYL